MYETHFLHDIAQQNYTKYNIMDAYKQIFPGTMLQVNNSESVGIGVARYYHLLNEKTALDADLNISLPVWDASSNGLCQYFL